MNNTPRFIGDRPLSAIGYKCNYREVPGFFTCEGGVNTEPGGPYLSHFPENYSNVYIIPIVFPHMIGRYFNVCNSIEIHNSIRQP